MLQSGDESALRYFMYLYGEKLRFFSYKIMKNKEAAEEIVSESFYALWNVREKLESIIALRNFLYLVTKNSCYDYLKSSYTRKMYLGDDWLSQIEDNDNDFLSHLIYLELIEQIVKELDNLPLHQAEVFKLSYFEGLSTDEICQSLGTTASSIYCARSKAISTLRSVFKEKNISIYRVFLLFILTA